MSIDTVHKLSSHSDWHKFQRTLKNFLVFNNLYDVVKQPIGPTRPSTGSHTRSGGTTNADVDQQYTNKRDLWNFKNEKALAVLRQRCSPNGKKIVENHDNFKAALDALENRYKPRGHSAFTEAMKRLRRTTLATCKGIEDFVQQLQEVQNQLTEVKVELPEAVLIDHFVENLTSEFDSWITSFFNHHVIVATDGFNQVAGFDEVVRAATEFEHRNKSVSEEPVSALLAGKVQDKYTIVGDTIVSYFTATDPYCTHCKRKGHKKEGCFALFPHLKEEYLKKRKSKSSSSKDNRQNKRPRTDTSNDSPSSSDKPKD